MDRVGDANDVTIMDSGATDCSNQDKMSEVVNGAAPLFLPENTEIVILETDDGQQEIQLINTHTGDPIEMDAELADQIRLRVASLSEDDVLEVSPESDTDIIVQQQQEQCTDSLPEQTVAEFVGEETTDTNIEETQIEQRDDCESIDLNRVRHLAMTSTTTSDSVIATVPRTVQGSMPSLSVMEHDLSSRVESVQSAENSAVVGEVTETVDVLSTACSLSFVTASPIKTSTNTLTTSTTGTVQYQSTVDGNIACHTRAESPGADDVTTARANHLVVTPEIDASSKDVITPGSSVAVLECNSGDDGSVGRQAADCSFMPGGGATETTVSSAGLGDRQAVTAEYSIKPCEDKTTADGFVKVVITRPDGERVTLNIPSETLNAHKQPSASKSAAQPSVQTSNTHQITARSVTRESARFSSPADVQMAPTSTCSPPFPWRRRARRVARRASRGVCRAVAALRRTQDSDASFSSDDSEVEVDGAQSRHSSTQQQQHASSRIVGQITGRGRDDSAKRLPADTMFLCVKCSSLFASDAALKQHTAEMHADVGSLAATTVVNSTGGDGVHTSADPIHKDTGAAIVQDVDSGEVRVDEVEQDLSGPTSNNNHANNDSETMMVADPTTTSVKSEHTTRIPALSLSPINEIAVESPATPILPTDCPTEPTINVDIISVSQPTQCAEPGSDSEQCWECAECDAVFQLESELRYHNDCCHLPYVTSSSSDSDMFTDDGGEDGGGLSDNGEGAGKRRPARSRNRRVTAAAVVSAWHSIVGGDDPTPASSAADSQRYCSMCDKRFCTVTALSDHVVRLHRSKLLEEGATFATGVTPVRRGKSEFTCHQCRMTYTSAKIYQRHMRSHLANLDAAQSEDRKEAVDSAVVMATGSAAPTRKRAVGRPRANRSGRPCGSSDSERQMVYDQIEVRSDGAFGCRLCAFVARTKNQAFYHVSTKHIVLGGAQCQVCNRSFYSEALLRIHMRSHTGERPFPCLTCGRAFRQNADLQSHMRSRHTNDRPYKCEVCDKSFSRRYSRTVHMRCHTDERNYACPYCEKRFRASTYLTAHLRVHTGERSHACPICHKTFRLQSDIRRHIFVHSREKIPRSQRKSRYLTSTNTGDGVISSDSVQNTVNDQEMKEAVTVMETDASLWSSAKTIFTYDDGTMLVTLDGNEENAVVVSSNSSDVIL